MRKLLMASLFAFVANDAWALAEGQMVPPLSGSSFDGRTVDLSQFRGRLVLLDFWASWCAPCAQSLPEYQRLQGKFQSRGFSVVTVNVDTKSDQSAALRFVERHAIDLPVIADPGGDWAKRFMLPTMPSAYLVSRSGSVIRVLKGFRLDEVSELEQQIDRELQEGNR